MKAALNFPISDTVIDASISIYGHLSSSIFVNVGQSVESNELIATADTANGVYFQLQQSSSHNTSFIDPQNCILDTWPTINPTLLPTTSPTKDLCLECPRNIEKFLCPLGPGTNKCNITNIDVLFCDVFIGNNCNRPNCQELPWSLILGQLSNYLEFDINTDDNIYAVEDGEVIDVELNSSAYAFYRRYVKIQHIDGYIAVYTRLKDITVNIGDMVVAGQIIGKYIEYSEPSNNFKFGLLNSNGEYVDPQLCII